MDMKNAVRDFFDRNLHLKEDTLEEVSNFKKFRNKKILDAGCGSGSRLIKFLSYGAYVYGIDQSKKSIDFLKNSLKGTGIENRAKLFVGDIEKTNFKSNSFDYIYCRGVLHLTPHPELALKEFKRILKKGGEIEILFANKHSLKHIHKVFTINLFKVFYPIFKFMINKNSKHYFWYKADKISKGNFNAFDITLIKKMCKETDLKIIEIKIKEKAFGPFEKFFPPAFQTILEKSLPRKTGNFIAVKYTK